MKNAKISDFEFKYKISGFMFDDTEKTELLVKMFIPSVEANLIQDFESKILPQLNLLVEQASKKYVNIIDTIVVRN